jgi:hypothetical protein
MQWRPWRTKISFKQTHVHRQQGLEDRTGGTFPETSEATETTLDKLMDYRSVKI